MERILYATDFSLNAERALPCALKMTHAHQAELIMLHVCDPPLMWNYPDVAGATDMARKSLSVAETRLKELIERYDQRVKVQFKSIRSSSVVSGILSAIDQTATDLVILGSRGESRIKEMITGSTTKALIKQASVPVLAVPPSASSFEPRQVLLATDLQEDDVGVIRQTVAMFRPFNPEIAVIHISTSNEYKGREQLEWFKDLLRETMRKDQIHFELLLSDDIYERLTLAVDEFDADLLVMLEKERNGIFDKLFHQDLVSKMEFHTRIPLLSFNEHYLRLQHQEGWTAKGQVS